MSIDKRQPVIFSGHGSPMNAIGDNRARDGWRAAGEKLGKPPVIIAISAHWTTRGLFVRRAEDNPQINDMYGFPKALYDVHYEPAGSIAYADKVLDCLGDMAAVNNEWGIDHGVWSILNTMYPDADVPVVMISTDASASPEAQFEVGRRLKPLRDDGAMILASGNVVHNLRRVDWDMDTGYDWADRFDETIRDAIISRHFDTPVNFKDIPDWSKAVPTIEHYYPLLTALGAADESGNVEVFNDYRELGSMSMTSYIVG